MDTRQMNDEYAQIGADLIATEPSLEPLRDCRATIVYLSSEHEKKSKRKLVLGECEKVPEKYKWAVPADFTITLFEPNVERMNPEQIRQVVFHELLHVGIEKDGNEESYFIVPHDVEDFRECIDRFGFDWGSVIL